MRRRTKIVCAALFLLSAGAAGLGVRALRAQEPSPLFQGLDLTADQESRVRRIYDPFMTRLEERCMAVSRERQKLFDLLRSDEPSREDLQRAMDEIQRLRGELQREIVDHVVEIKSILTPAQRARYVENLYRLASPVKRP